MGTQEKLLTDKITKQIGDSQKTIQEKITAQEKSVKDVSDKIGKTSFMIMKISYQNQINET